MAFKNDQVSEIETAKILEIAREGILRDGDFVEMGCYKGDTSLLLAEILIGTNKRLFIYDSFEGLPEKSGEDESIIGKDFKAKELFVTKREVKQRFLRANLPVPVIKKAWFKELSFNDLPEKISFAFLDGDFYESILESLKLVENKMVKDGVIIIHDFANPALPGVAKAVDEWNMDKKLKIEIFKSMAIIKLR